MGKSLTLSKGIQSASSSLLRYLKQQIDQTMRLILTSLIIVSHCWFWCRKITVFLTCGAHNLCHILGTCCSVIFLFVHYLPYLRQVFIFLVFFLGGKTNICSLLFRNIASPRYILKLCYLSRRCTIYYSILFLLTYIILLKKGNQKNNYNI